MTTSERDALVGQTVAVQFEDIRVACVVRDAKWAFGRVTLLVEPIEGEGRQWVNATRVIPEEQC